MNQLAEVAVSMSSVEIAELTGKDHRNVMRDIRNMLNLLENTSAQNRADVPARLETVLDERNRPREAYFLGKHHTMVLITGYSVPLRAAVIHRMDQLERQVANMSLTISNMTLPELESLIEDRVAQLIREMQHAPAQPVPLLTVDQNELMTPSQLGFLKRVSGTRINRILLDLGFQIRGDRGYLPEPRFAEFFDLTRRVISGNGSIKAIFKWKRSVLEQIPERYFR